MDVVLHADRLEGRGAHQRKRTYWEHLAKLPDGVFLRLDGSAWLLWSRRLPEWSPGGYHVRQPLPSAASHVEVLTARSLVAVLRAGYPLQVHVSADEVAGNSTLWGHINDHT
jgi:hypothetical protein